MFSPSNFRFRPFLSTFVLAFSFACTGHAFFVAVPTSQGAVRFDQPTRILVSGRGTDLATQPQLSALGRARLYRRNFAADQVVLISIFETPENRAALLNQGWTFVVENAARFDTEAITREILIFQRLNSLEFFGHNSPSLGTQTDGPGLRYDFRHPIVATIASHFERGAYAIIHGCNSGWILAQGLSKVWGIAVAGSFTGTRFEHLHSDGHFYVYDDARAPNNHWATRTADGESCAGGGCIRMRPAYAPYVGKWGDYDGPLLSHYKFFCQLDEAACEKTMALSLFGFTAERSLRPGAGEAEFRRVVQEYLCPVYKDRTITENCYRQLSGLEQGQTPPTVSFVVGAPQLSCNLKACSGVMKCDDHTCKIDGRQSKDSTTLAQEYRHFMNGFRAL
jgi:hypothetical protein